MITFQAPLEKGESNLMWYYYFMVPDEVVSQIQIEEDRRVVCYLNDHLKMHCALMPNGKGAYYVTLNQERRKKLGLRAGELVKLSMKKDDSAYGVPMSDELREVLDQESLADELFHQLTPGKQRTLIHWVDNVKSSEIKIRRAFVMCRHLVAQEGNIDFKALNQEIKQANQEAKRY